MYYGKDILRPRRRNFYLIPIGTYSEFNCASLASRQTVAAMVDIASNQPQDKVNFRPDAWNSGNASK